MKLTCAREGAGEMNFKDLYIAEVERISAELEAEGLDPNLAYDRASNTAYHAARGRYADMADAVRQRDKDDQ